MPTRGSGGKGGARRPLAVATPSSASRPCAAAPKEEAIKPAQAQYTVEMRVGRKFRIGSKLGSGAFGDIYMGNNVQTGEKVAIKLEQCSTKHPTLPDETRVYRALGNAVGVPRIHWYGVENGCNVLVMDLMGPSLEDLLVFCRRRFSLKTVLMLGDQMITRLQHLHDRGFIHGDIKPDNFVIGLGRQANHVHLIDLGLARRYRDPETHAHLPLSCSQSLAGTARFASVNAHLGVAKSRRDDLESLGYTMLYFLRGRLPWQSIAAVSRKDWSKIMELKTKMSIEVLCKDLPREVCEYMLYCRKLRFDDEPDYDFLRDLLQQALLIRGLEYNYAFDWTLLCIGADDEDDEAEGEKQAKRPATNEAKEGEALPGLQRSSTGPFGTTLVREAEAAAQVEVEAVSQ